MYRRVRLPRYVVNYTGMQRIKGHPASAGRTQRPVRLLAAGGTIAMRGEQAVPALDARRADRRSFRSCASGPPLQTETILALPSAQLALDDAFGWRVARRRRAGGRGGRDHDRHRHDGGARGAVRAGARRRRADRHHRRQPPRQPARAPTVPRTCSTRSCSRARPPPHGLGVVIAFGGEIHAAMTVRKIDSTGPTAFGSPTAGPLGRIVERRVWLHAMPIRPKPLPVRAAGPSGGGRGDGAGRRRRAAQARGRAAPTALSLVALGAGHLPPGGAAASCTPRASACRS